MCKVVKSLCLAGIKNYKMIVKDKIRFSYRKFEQKPMTEFVKELNITVIFETPKGSVTKFVISKEESDENISEMIRSCIENTTNTDTEDLCIDDFSEVNFSENDFYKTSFLQFDPELYHFWIENQLEGHENLGVFYKIELYRYQLMTSKGDFEQFFVDSDLFYFDPANPEKFYSGKHKFLNDNWFDDLVEENHQKLSFNHDGKKMILTKEALATFLENYVRLFYADYIYFNHTGCKLLDDLNKEVFSANFNLISLPYEGIIFDAEGTKIREHFLIKNGQIVGFICNGSYSKYLQIENSGNSSLNQETPISHQRIKATFNEDVTDSYEDVSYRMVAFENLVYDSYQEIFMGVVLSHDGQKFDLQFKTEDILNDAIPMSRGEWVNESCFCQDIKIPIFEGMKNQKVDEETLWEKQAVKTS
ncbi:MAG: hypothetical protein LBT69_03270 [Lactobacillales bacterium]|nr:hypothetical protein [Lactobacillales bacterium]